MDDRDSTDSPRSEKLASESYKACTAKVDSKSTNRIIGRSWPAADDRGPYDEPVS